MVRLLIGDEEDSPVAYAGSARAPWPQRESRLICRHRASLLSGMYREVDSIHRIA